ncbi:SGNH/GDSL hydrolase family protein [Ureaplasma sp. ES3154-GEN]|uniref:SGNH/GDSL hydrolase family protein n=1 Tax=Ureaplasma sp. ES3154-GEN TaxID=2984844 RepID=UPI0021E838B9|nr:SGNH/GDSL hydrolase family protein [Ureaplasma sp. ES3154-GEN]MCV3743301.1 SGNH/GDSL hydrolase family protein [Ureaplasma sp. ES3154-GEN]
MIKKKKIIAWGLISALTTASVGTLAASCAKEEPISEFPDPIEKTNEEKQKEEDKKDLINRIGGGIDVVNKPNNKQLTSIAPNADLNVIEIPKTQIKYVALGDSITAGFNDILGSDLAGELIDNEISGLSYPAFLVDFMQRLNQNAVLSYDNAAMTGSTVASWLYLFNDRNPAYTNGDKSRNLRFGYALDQQDNAAFRDRLAKYFDPIAFSDQEISVEQMQQATSKLRLKIKDANFLTLTLGANDFILSHTFTSLIRDLFGATDEGVAEVFTRYENQILEELNVISANIAKFVSILQQINPQLKINLIGYPKPLLRWEKMLNKLWRVKDANNQWLSDFLLNNLNNAIANAAAKTNVNYISTFDYDDWYTNRNVFTRSLFDIHPTEIGYKKMAQDILLKLSLNTTTDSYRSEDLPMWNSAYIKTDKDKYHQQLWFSDYTNQTLINTLVGHNNSVLWTKTKNENALLNNQGVNYRNKTSAIVSSWITNHPELIDQMLFYFQDVLRSLGIDDIGVKTNFLGQKDEFGKSNFYKLVKAFAETKILDNIFIGVQNEIDAKALADPNYDLTYEDFISSFKNNLLKSENIIETIKTLLTSSVFLQHPNETKTVIKAILKYFFNSPLLIDVFLKKGLNASSINIKDDLQTILSSINTSGHLETLISAIVDDLFDHTSVYYSYEKLPDLLVALVKNNTKVIRENVNGIVQNLLDDQKTRSTLLEIIKKTFATDFLDIIDEPNIKEIMDKILLRLNSLVTFEKMSANVFEMLNDPGFYNHLFHTEQKQNDDYKWSLFKIDLADLINDLFAILSQENISSDQWQRALISILGSNIIHQSLNNGLIPLVVKLIQNKKISFDNFLEQFIAGLKKQEFTRSQKEHFKKVLGQLITTLFNNDTSQNIIKLITNYGINRLGDLLIKQDNVVLNKIKVDLFQVIEQGIKTLIPSDTLNDILTNILFNFIDHNHDFASQSYWTNFLTTLLDVNSTQLQDGIKKVLGLWLKNPDINQHLINIILTLIEHYLPLKQPLNAEIKQALTRILSPLLSSLGDLKTFALIQERIFSVLGRHLAGLASKQVNSLPKFTNDLIATVLSTLPDLVELLELAEIDAIKTDDVKEVISFFVDNINYESIVSKNENTGSVEQQLDVLDLVYKTLMRFINSSYLNNSVDNPSAKIQSNRQKVKEVLEHTITSIFNSQSLKKMIVSQIQKVLLENRLFAEQENGEQLVLIERLVNAFFNESHLDVLLKSIINKTLDNPDVFTNTDNFLSFISVIIRENKEQVKNWLNNFVTNLLSNDDFLNFVFSLIIPLINNTKTWNDVERTDQDTLKAFIKKAITSIVNLQLYNDVVDQLLNLISDPATVNVLLTSGFESIIQKLLQSIHLETPQQIANLVNDIQTNISAREYADFINTIVFKVRLNFKIKKDNADQESSNNSARLQQTDTNINASNFVTELIRAIFANGFNSSTGTKIKEIIKLLIDDLKNERIVVNTERYQVFAGLLEQITYHTNSEINDKIKALVKAIINDNQLLNQLADLVQIIINDLFDNHSAYGQINSVKDIIHILFANKKEVLKENIHDTLEMFVSNETINDNLVDVVFAIIIQQLDQFSEENVLLFKSVIKKVLKHIPDLNLYNELFDKFFDLTENIFASILVGEKINLQPLINLLTNNLANFVEVLDLIKYDDISVDEIKEVIDIALNHLITTPDTQSTNVQLNDQQVVGINYADLIFKILKKVSSLDLLHTKNEKFQTVLQYLLDNVFASSNLKTRVVRTLLANSQSKMFFDLIWPTENQETNLLKIVNQTFNKEFKDVVWSLIQYFISHPNDWQNANDLASLINLYANGVQSGLKTKIATYLSSLNNANDLWKFLAQVIIKRINPDFVVDAPSTTIERLTTILRTLGTNLFNIPFVSNLYDGIFELFKEKSKVEGYLVNKETLVADLQVLFDFKNPEHTLRLLDILDLEDINAQQISDLIFNLIFDVHVFSSKDTITSETNANDQSKDQEVNYVDVIFNYIKVFNNHSLNENVKTKLQTIVNNLLSILKTDHLYHEQLVNLLAPFYNQLITILGQKVPFIAEHKTWWISFYAQLMQNDAIWNSFSALVKKLFADYLDNKQAYTQDSWQTLLSEFVKQNIQNDKNLIKDLIVQTLSNLKELNIYQFAIDQFTLIGDELDAPTQTTLINALEPVINKIPTLKIFNDGLDKVIELAQTNFMSFLNNDFSSLKTYWTNDFNTLTNWLNLLEVLTRDDLNIQDLNTIIHTLVSKISVQKIQDLVSQKVDSSATDEQTETLDINNVLGQIFKIINNLVKNQYFNESTKTKIHTLLTTLLNAVFENTNIKSYLATTISEFVLKLNLDSFITLTAVQKQDLVQKIIEQVYKNEHFKNLLTHFVQNLLSTQQDFKDKTDFWGLVNFWFTNQKTTIKEDINHLIQSIFNDDIISEQVSYFIFNIATYKAPEEIKHQNFVDLKALIKVIANNITRTSIYQDTLDALLNVFASSTDIVLVKNFIEKKIDASQLFVRKIFNYDENKEYADTVAKVLQILELNDLDVNIIATGAIALVNEIDWNRIFKNDSVIKLSPENSTSTENSSNVTTINQGTDPQPIAKVNNYYKYVKALFEFQLSNTAKDKGKEVVNKLVDVLQTKALSPGGFLTNLFKDLGIKLSSLIIQEIPLLSNLQTDFQDLFATLFNNQAMIVDLTDQLKYFVDKFIDDAQNYRSTNTFGQLVKEVLKLNKTEFIIKIKDVFKKHFVANSPIITKLSDVFVKTVKKLLNLPDLNEEDRSKIANIIKVFIPHVFDLEIISKTLDHFVNFLENNAEKMIDEEQNFTSLFKTNVLPEITKPEYLANVIELIKYDDSTLINFMDVLLKLIPYEQYKKMFDPILLKVTSINNQDTVDQNETTNKPSPFALVLKTIAYVLKANVLKDQQNQNKLKETTKQLINKFLKSEHLSRYVIDVLQNKFTNLLVEKTGIASDETQRFISGAYSWFRDSEILQKILRLFIDDVFKYKDTYADLLLNNEPLNVINNFIDHNFEAHLKEDILNFVINFVTSNATTRYVAKIMFNKLKLEGTNENDIEIVANLIKQVMKHIRSFDFLIKPVEKIQSIFKEHKLATFQPDHLAEIASIVNKYITGDPMQFTKILSFTSHIDNDQSKIHVIYLANFINLIFEKSPLVNYDNLSTNQPLFFAMHRNNIQTKNFINEIIPHSTPPSELKITGANPLEAIKTFSYNMWKADENFWNRNRNLTYKDESPYHRAMFHITLAVLWFAHETYFRDVGAGVWWNAVWGANGVGIVGKNLSGGATSGYAADRVWNDIFGDYSPTKSARSYEWGYRDFDYLYMITYWNSKRNLKNNIKVENKNRNKVNYIFESMKRGRPASRQRH